jgi:hypothetical protein
LLAAHRGGAASPRRRSQPQPCRPASRLVRNRLAAGGRAVGLLPSHRRLGAAVVGTWAGSSSRGSPARSRRRARSSRLRAGRRSGTGQGTCGCRRPGRRWLVRVSSRGQADARFRMRATTAHAEARTHHDGVHQASTVAHAPGGTRHTPRRWNRVGFQAILALARPRCAAVRSPYTTHNREVDGSNPSGAIARPVAAPPWLDLNRAGNRFV